MSIQDYLKYKVNHNRVYADTSTSTLSVSYKKPIPSNIRNNPQGLSIRINHKNGDLNIYKKLPKELALPSLKTFVFHEGKAKVLNVVYNSNIIGLASSSIMVKNTLPNIITNSHFDRPKQLLNSNYSSMNVMKSTTVNSVIPLINKNTIQILHSNPLICTRKQTLGDSNIEYYNIPSPLFGGLNNIYLKVTAGKGVYIKFKNTDDSRVDIISVTGMLACLKFDAINSCIIGVPVILGKQTIIIKSNSNLKTTLTLEVLPSNIMIN